MVRDAALRGAFMSLFAFLCVMVRVRVRPDCHQRCHQKHLDETWFVTGGRRLIPVLGSVRPWTGLEKLDSGCGTDYLAKIAQAYLIEIPDDNVTPTGDNLKGRSTRVTTG